MVEYAFLGVPSIIIPQTLNEELFAGKFQSGGASVLVKKEHIPDSLCTEIINIVDSSIKSDKMASAGRIMSDGLGKKRISEILKEQVKNGS